MTTFTPRTFGDVASALVGVAVNVHDVYDDAAVSAVVNGDILLVSSSPTSCSGFVGTEMYPFALTAMGGAAELNIVAIGENPWTSPPLWSASALTTASPPDAVVYMVHDVVRAPWMWRFRTRDGVISVRGESARSAITSLDRRYREAAGVVPVPLNRDRRKYPVVPPSFISSERKRLGS